MNRGGQLALFTPMGRAYTPEQHDADLRVAVLQGISKSWGCDVLDETCPACGQPEISLVLHPVAPTAFCECGWWMDVNADAAMQEGKS